MGRAQQLASAVRWVCPTGDRIEETAGASGGAISNSSSLEDIELLVKRL
jgi:hypothetical protein